MPEFDAIVIGTGQAGPALARRLAGAGMTVAIIERKLFGGTCVNTGCTPTKALVASAYAAHMARRAAEFGVNVGGPVSVDMKRVKARMRTIVSPSTQGRGAVAAQDRGLHRLPGSCPLRRRRARSRSARSVLTAEKIFINVGGRRAVPEMPGLDEVDYFTNSSLLEMRCPAAASDRHRRQLYRPRICANLSPLRQRGDGDRDVAAPRAARGRGRVQGHRGHPGARRDRDSPECAMHCRRQARRATSPQMSIAPKAPRKWRAAISCWPWGGAPTPTISASTRPASPRSEAASSTVDDQLRTNCAGHLGARRLQRQGRLHPHLLERLRDRRRQSARQGRAPRERPHHRPTASSSIRRWAASV